jgi:exodeoxyribonuclease V gamma subunit
LLYLYPSNRLEDLAILLAEVVKTRPRNILMPTKVLVPNPGMQHWLNMQLCEHLGISMNIDCPMPTRYVWDLCREVLGSENIPQKSPYKREVLTWKIYELCQSTPCKQSDFYPQLSLYWAQASTEIDQQRRMFSFARQLADLFEQYLVFRPDWLQQWEKNQSNQFTAPRYQLFEQWQQWFWLQLTAWMPAHPVALQFQAIAALSDRKKVLPNDIYIFSINSISPIYLTFFDEISQHTNVHLFQLNPCVNYWGDAQSDIAIAKIQRRQAQSQSLDENAVHPLLRNLGAQGRDLNNLLADMQHQEIAAFNLHENSLHTNDKYPSTLLQHLQNDILSSSSVKNVKQYDGSIAVHACHSEVRELQVLKDVLLDKFSQTPHLQPKDILVMCPSIEAYSPYIRSVFTQSAQPAHNLPVSISDRQPIESQAYIVAFMQLLSMPTARFDATGIIDLISLPALADKYKLTPQDIEVCASWINDASIDWGKDVSHLSQQIGGSVSDEMHTWHWGVSRLLVGLINAANETLVDGFSPVSYIEGQATVVLGKFLQALESLERVTQQLKVSQDIRQWTKTLVGLMNEHLQANDDDEFAQKLLVDAIYSLEKNTLVADFEGPIALPILQEALTSILSIPEVRSQFYSGNITFCSMLPMRSIPFKVIAILGLNQSDFPRQDNPIEIDLIQESAARRGDRSRRGDDRYLFLESLVSARQYLHLSFQHRHIKNNSVREPSLVVKMLLDFCHQHYSPESLPIIEHALHPFSADSFLPKIGYSGSYDAGWFTCLESVQKSLGNAKAISLKSRLATSISASDAINSLRSAGHEVVSNSAARASETINTQELAKFLKGTLPYYAKQVLSLYLDKPQARDYSPVYSIDGLTQYALRLEVLTLLKQDHDGILANAIAENGTSSDTKSVFEIWMSIRQTWLLSGKLPFLVGVEDELNKAFLDTYALQLSLANKAFTRRAKGKLVLGNVSLEYDFNYDLIAGVKLLRLNPKAPSLSHFIEPWIQYLVLLIHIQTDEEFQQFQAESKQFNADINSSCLNDNISEKRNDIDPVAKFGVHIHYVEASARKSGSDQQPALKQVNICQLVLDQTANAIEVLGSIVSVFKKGCKTPILIDLSLAAEILKFASADEALASAALLAKWSTCNKPSDNGPDLFPRTYFDFLLGEIPAFEKENIQIYFDCFAAIQQTIRAPIMVDLSAVDYTVLRKSKDILTKGDA